MRRASIGLVALLLVASAVVACNFHVAGFQIPLSSDLGSPDLRGFDAGPPDLSQCTTEGAGVGCNGDVLLVCMNGKPTTGMTCVDGCNTKGGAHCASLDPGGAAQPSDYLQSGLESVSLSGTVTFFTDSGAINGLNPTNRGQGSGVDGATGIYYRLAKQADGSTIGIFSFASLTVSAGSIVQVSGSSPLVLLAAGNIDIEGMIDVSGTCMPGTAVAGGGLGGNAGVAGANPGMSTVGGGGVGVATTNGGGGGGGGGYGDVGGMGGAGADSATSGGAAGKLFGDLTLVDPILSGGGGGGGGGGVLATAPTNGVGGSGGGAIQIASNGAITFVGGTINAGGCHGSGGGVTGSGGGGGAGGSILIEGRTITLDNNSAIASNGGGGGGGALAEGGTNGSDGADAAADDKKPNGGKSGSAGTDGGSGAAKSTTGGSDVGNPSGNDFYGGGGGGAAGRIALKTKTGTVADSGATISPSIGAASPALVSPSTDNTPASFE